MDDFVQFVLDPEKVPKPSTLSEMIQREIEAIFKLVDENQDGVISEAELHKAINAGIDSTVQRADVSEVMKALDLDKDGYIDLSEFRSFMENQITDGVLLSGNESMHELESHLKKFDVDGKGWLTIPETRYQQIPEQE